MRWTAVRVPQIRDIVDRYNIYDRIAVNNLTLFQWSGTPTTIYNNVAITSTGALDTNITKCYCWNEQEATPDRKHFLCHGTGSLGYNGFNSGYQKYGFYEIVFGTPCEHTKSNNVIITGSRNSTFTMSGSSLSETITTEKYNLPEFKDVDYLLLNDSVDPSQNRIEYAYSTNDVDWISVEPIDYLDTPLANKKAIVSLPEDTEYIRFRITLLKRYESSPPPKFNSIRFRYRYLKTLSEFDPNYNINIPAFLASREQVAQAVRQGELGWETYFPVRWKTLPDVRVENGDVIMFLQGEFKSMKFITNNVVRYAYGADTRVLHRSFDSVYLRDNKEILGIAHYLI